MRITREYLDSIEIIPIMDTLRLQKIDDAEYFSVKYNGYISNSRLSLINPTQDNSPRAFFEGLSKHNKYSDSLIFGSAVHELVLQPELFHLCETVDRPTAKAGFMADELYSIVTDSFATNKQKNIALNEASQKIGYFSGKFSHTKKCEFLKKASPYWRARKKYENTNPDTTPIYLDAKGRERLKTCVQAINTNKDIQKLLHPEGLLETPISENEQAILLDVLVKMPTGNEFILKIKAKLDNYTIDKETNTLVVNDVKTLGRPISEFPINFEKYHYHRELSLYSWLLTLVAKKYYGISDGTLKANCLVVSTIPPYDTQVYPVIRGDFSKGWTECKNLLKLVAHYYDKGYRFS